MSAHPEIPAEDAVNIEVDGQPCQARKGAMIIEVTDALGISVPRFCYHKKLSVAANCRMCMVEVEKVPKPLPACATPVADGMKIFTKSDIATGGQKAVMEFLLINHPLDCPICDQGGECELQDQAMGYGRSVSRFTERKRVVKDKDVGPLVQTEMTRCIHCTRCVRFLDEIAGTQEMGGSGRGDRLEIGTCVENSIDSEMSGNIIDLCPVGALTNKPFRFAARAWELMAKPSIALHDGVGSHLYHHVRRGEALRSVPRQNDDLNETWLSDRDRYSVHGLGSDKRVLAPQVKKDGEWTEVSWDEAIEAVAEILKNNAGEQAGMLMSPSATNEEYYLAQSMMRGLGSENIDHRLRQGDFSDDVALGSAPSFEMKVADIDRADAILLVGCNPRHEAPIIGHRVRQAQRNGAGVSVVNPVNWKLNFETSLDAITAPQKMVPVLAGLAAAVEKVTGDAAPGILRSTLDSASYGDVQEALAARLKEAGNGLVMLGQSAMAHGNGAWLRVLAGYIASATGCSFNILAQGGNSRGAWAAGAVPQSGSGKNVAEMAKSPLGTYVLWGIEPGFDIDFPVRAVKALHSADKVITVASYAASGLFEFSDVILPLAPTAESEGSIINLDGDILTFSPAAKASGEARSGWKILRKLGETLGLEGFDQTSLAEVQAGLAAAMEQEAVPAAELQLAVPEITEGLYRIGDVPVYAVDAQCRRSEPLQQTIHAGFNVVGLNPADAARLGLEDGARARVSQGGPEVEFEVTVSDRVPEGGAWLRSATCETRKLGSAFAPINVEVA